jgi:glycerol-3-phosphate dehydrogenase (NAD(P)+)
MNKLQVGLLGGGSWGTTVASLVARNTDIAMWARDADTVKEINKKHTNEKYLPGATLPKDVIAHGRKSRCSDYGYTV